MGVNVSQWSNACNVRQKQKTNKRIIYEISTQIMRLQMKGKFLDRELLFLKMSHRIDFMTN